MTRAANPRRFPRCPGLLLAVLLAAVPAQLDVQAAKILFVVNDAFDEFTTANANDQETMDRLVGQGHTVKLATDDNVNAADVNGQDLVIISSSSSSTASGVNSLSSGMLRTARIPVINYEPALHDELLLQRSDGYGNAGGQTSLAISTTQQSHPLAAGKSGVIEVVVAGDSATFSTSALPFTLGDDAIVIATNATPDSVDLGRVAIWAYDAGARLADNSTIVAGRRVAFFWNASTAPFVYDQNAIALYNAAVQWALQPPANVPVTIASRSPAPGETRVSSDASIAIEIADGSTTQVNQSSIQLKVEGSTVTPVIARQGNATTVTYKPSTPFGSGQAIDVELTFADTASPPKAASFEWQFTTQREATSPEPFRQNDLGFVVIEAENFHTNAPGQLHDWTFATTPTAFSGDGTMYALPDSGDNPGMPDAMTISPRLDYKVSFTKTGTHYLWFRGSDGGGDSLHAGFNDEDPTGTNLDNIDQDCCGTRAAGGTTFTWVGGTGSGLENRSTFEVAAAGVHTIHLWMRENGMIVDKILVTTDPDYVPSDAGPEESRRVGDPVKPLATITSPAGGARLPATGNVTITANATDADGTVAKVEFFVGEMKIGEDTAAPFSIDWTPAGERAYTLTARATDNTGDTSTSPAIKVVVGNPPNVLYLGNNPDSNAGDQVIIGHLENRGFQVTTVDDNDSDTSQADGKTLIVISSTVSSGNVADKFTLSAVPIINWEEALMDDLLLTGDSGSEPDHHGTTGGQTVLDIVNATHPLAAGLSAGPQPVYSTGQTVSWGFPDDNAANAIIIATVAANTNQVAIFAYEKGATLYDAFTKAPERRVATFLNGDSTTALTGAGLKLVDAAINWALNITVTEPASVSIAKSGNQVSISWTGGGTLQHADTVTGPWSDVPNQNNPQTVATTGTVQFFRVRQ